MNTDFTLTMPIATVYCHPADKDWVRTHMVEHEDAFELQTDTMLERGTMRMKLKASGYDRTWKIEG